MKTKNDVLCLICYHSEFAGPELSGILATFFTFEESCSVRKINVYHFSDNFLKFPFSYSVNL